MGGREGVRADADFVWQENALVVPPAQQAGDRLLFEAVGLVAELAGDPQPAVLLFHLFNVFRAELAKQGFDAFAVAAAAEA